MFANNLVNQPNQIIDQNFNGRKKTVQEQELFFFGLFDITCLDFGCRSYKWVYTERKLIKAYRAIKLTKDDLIAVCRAFFDM